MDFDCYYTDGYRYLARITNVLVFPAIPGYLFDIFLCIEFQQITTNSFLYWRANNVNPSLSNEKAFMRAINYNTTTSDACEISKPYSSGTHSTMVKKDNEASAAVTCPPEFNSNTHYYYDYTGARECGPSNSSLDGCTSTDTLSFNYSACANPTIYMAFSNSGNLFCLYYTTDNSITYLTLYNNDTNPDESTFYRFSCVAFALSGSTVMYATVYPQACLSTQTTTSVSSPGEDLYFGIEFS
nr:hypothetical protein BaRGS_022200 [Batillaria attramentaria]